MVKRYRTLGNSRRGSRHFKIQISDFRFQGWGSAMSVSGSEI
jgi:hypothetical protein